ncbi:hypothetical protein pb186bvf_007737 [Paramecium bursaria]
MQIFHPQLSQQIHCRCVCEICKCGKHRCPNCTEIKGDFKTTFQASYQPWRVKRRQNYNYDRPLQTHQFSEPIKSQYQSEYREFQLPTKVPRPQTEQLPGQPFYADSDYRHNYKKFDIKPKRKEIPKQYTSPERQVGWGSIYKTDFIKNASQPPESFKIKVKDGPEGFPEFGSTIYRESYIPKQARTQQFKAPLQRNIYGDPGRVENSTYRHDYQENPLRGEICPVETLPSRPNLLHQGQSHIKYDAYRQQWI